MSDYIQGTGNKQYMVNNVTRCFLYTNFIEVKTGNCTHVLRKAELQVLLTKLSHRLGELLHCDWNLI